MSDTNSKDLSVDGILQAYSKWLGGKHGINRTQAIEAIQAHYKAEREEAERLARNSEQNRLFALMRYLGVEHNAKDIMRLYKKWHVPDQLANIMDSETFDIYKDYMEKAANAWRDELSNKEKVEHE